jgi:outer membrane protein
MAFCLDPQNFEPTTKNSESHSSPDRNPEKRRSFPARKVSWGSSRLRAAVATACMLSTSMPLPGYAQQAPPAGQSSSQGSAPSSAAAPAPTSAQGLPSVPPPNYTQPLFMRPGKQDFSKPNSAFPNFLKPYEPVSVPPPLTLNSGRLSDLLHNGKIYLSLADAIVLGLENNYDIAIQRYNLNIADTDLLRARAGASLLGVSSGLVEGTLGGTGVNSNSLTSGGGPGGTSTAVGGAGAGTGGIVTTTSGAGPTPEQLDPNLTGKIQLERAKVPQASPFLSGGLPQLTTNTDQYNFSYNQGFVTGTSLNVGFNNSRVTTDNGFDVYSPQLQSSFQAMVTQHLLNGFGTGINGRFIIVAKNNRRISDSAFRQQILYTINQIENIYWQLVADYEDVQAKERALQQSTQLAADNRRQLAIGTLAPLDVLNADNGVASDRQALITSQTALEYQQLIMKQAISRDLSDPTLSAAPVIPTDRVSLVETPEERTPVEQLVQEAYANRPEIEQAVLNLKNDEVTLKAVKNGLLPTVDLYAFYNSTALGGSENPHCTLNQFLPGACTVPPVGYGTVFQNLFNSTGPDKGVGVNVSIPLRNRTAQALQARALLEYRQAQMRLQQLYIQVRIQVINGQYALTNDRAALQAAQAAREYNYQSYQAEVKKLRLGASTTANVLLQEKNLAAAENNVTSTEATYAKDRASLEELLASTLDRYGIQLSDAVSGTVTQQPTIPGIAPASPSQEVTVPGQQQQLQQTEHPPAVNPELPPQPPLTPQEQQAPPPPPPPAPPPQ